MYMMNKILELVVFSQDLYKQSRLNVKLPSEFLVTDK